MCYYFSHKWIKFTKENICVWSSSIIKKKINILYQYIFKILTNYINIKNIKNHRMYYPEIYYQKQLIQRLKIVSILCIYRMYIIYLNLMYI